MIQIFIYLFLQFQKRLHSCNNLNFEAVQVRIFLQLLRGNIADCSHVFVASLSLAVPIFNSSFIDRDIWCCNQTSYCRDFSSRGSSMDSWFVCIQDMAFLFWRRDESLALDAIELLLALGMSRNSSLIDYYTLGSYSIDKQVQKGCRSFSPCKPFLFHWKFWIILIKMKI